MSPVLIKGLIAVGGVGLGGVGIWQFNEYMAPKTIRERLERDGESFYSFEVGKDNEQWKVLAKEYKSGTTSNTNLKIDGVEITKEDPDTEEIKKLQSGCKQLAEGSLEENYEANMQKVKRWCVVKKTGTTDQG